MAWGLAFDPCDFFVLPLFKPKVCWPSVSRMVFDNVWWPGLAGFLADLFFLGTVGGLRANSFYSESPATAKGLGSVEVVP